MRRTLAAALLLAAGCAAGAPSVPPEPPAGENLLPNAGFEEHDGRRPEGWTCPERGRFVSEAAAHAGEAALRLAVASEGGAARAVSPLVPIRGGLYEIAGWFEFDWPEGDPPGPLAERVSLSLELLGEDGAPMALASGKTALALHAALEGVRSDETEGWTELHLAGAFYPHQTLELPEAARAARLRLALLRPGEMRVDDLRLVRSKRNDTLRSRVLPFLDAADGAPVFPTPREIELTGERVPFAAPAEGRVPCVATAGPPAGAVGEGLAQLSQALTLLSDRHAPVPTVEEAARSPRLACAAILDLRVAPGMGPEDYAIDAEARGQTPWIAISAGSGRGLYYGVTTLAQLLEPDPSGAGPVRLRVARVRDGPAYALRGVSGFGGGSGTFDREIELARWAPSVRLNAFFFNYPALGERWWAPEEPYWKALGKLGGERRAHGLFELGALVNVYAERAANPEADFIVSHPGDLARATDLAARLAEAGVTELMACADDFTPTVGPGRHDYGLRSEADRERFGALAPAHAYLLGEIGRAAGPAVALAFVPPWYNGRFMAAAPEKSAEYLAELGRTAPPRIPLAWTGPAVRSLEVDRPQLLHWRRAVGEARPTLYWDNTLYARAHADYWLRSPARAHRASWLEPYGAELYAGAERDLAGMYVNGHATELYRIKYMTAADYLWNPEAYDPDRSLARALVLLYGRDFAERLLAWDERFWAARERLNRARERMEPEFPAGELDALRAGLADLRAHPDAEKRLLDELEQHLEELATEIP